MPLFFTILMICILTGAEVDLFIPSFPELQRVFDLSPFMVQLTLSANFVPYCLCTLFAGALGDRYNRKDIIFGSLVIFVLGSILCVGAINYPMLLLGRVLQGIGMAGPSILAFVVISDEYPIQKQPAMLGKLNGVVTLAMAFAPVVGSYVNLYFNWRGNFIVLLILGLICLVSSYFVIPDRKGDPNVSLSIRAYKPLLYSQKLLIFILGICFLVVPYWVFIGMAPILYMEDMGVDLKHFGYYQGVIAGVFSIISLFSSKILNKFGQKKCLYYSVILCSISMIVMLFNTLSETQNPIIITSIMVIYASSVVFPINILYPISLEVMEGSKSRIAALITALKLLLTASMLELISYVYVGKFYPIGLAIFLMTGLALLFIRHLFYRGWAHIEEQMAES